MNDLDGNCMDKIHKILIVDDELDELNALSLTLQYAKQFKCEISMAKDPIEALAKLENGKFDIILSDFNMPKMDGIQFLKTVKEKYPSTIRMLITACADLEIAKNAINNAEIHNFIEKPWYNDELREIINEALKRKSERETLVSKEVNNVDDAVVFINDALHKIMFETLGHDVKQNLILEFKSNVEFNKFFYEIKKMNTVKINDVHIFEDKYIIELGI